MIFIPARVEPCNLAVSGCRLCCVRARVFSFYRGRPLLSSVPCSVPFETHRCLQALPHILNAMISVCVSRTLRERVLLLLRPGLA